MGKTTKVATKSNAGSEAELKALTHSILKKIKEKQLEVLLQAVESKGGARSPCLLLPSKVDAKVGQQSYSLPMLLYKVFRWPDLRHSSELKRLSCCESYGKINPELVCCNPHHMSRLCELGEIILRRGKVAEYGVIYTPPHLHRVMSRELKGMISLILMTSPRFGCVSIRSNLVLVPHLLP